MRGHSPWLRVLLFLEEEAEAVERVVQARLHRARGYAKCMRGLGDGAAAVVNLDKRGSVVGGEAPNPSDDDDGVEHRAGPIADGGVGLVRPVDRGRPIRAGEITRASRRSSIS
jgi:hypothetical protein